MKQINPFLSAGQSPPRNHRSPNAFRAVQ